MTRSMPSGSDNASDDHLDEKYWEALLSQGEFSQSVDSQISNQPYISERDSNPIQAHNFESETLDFIYEDASENDWEAVEAIQDNDEVLHLKVVGYNRGGLLVDWHSLRGFVPASQLIDFPGDGFEQQRQNLLTERVGETISLRIIELDPDKNRLIFSERAAQANAGNRMSLLYSLEKGDVLEGIVTNLCDFGAFVDLGGIEGLIHISEMSWGRVAHPSDMLSRGQRIKVYVLDITPEESRIALSIKRLHRDPWETVDERYQEGQIVEGRITNVVDFGAFACIEEGLEGLIHFSELAEGQFLHPRNVVSEGDIVSTRILSISGKKRRLALSLRIE
ncbi:MAG: S1 RNA-binding domain-containing protein [Anaerolineae bacterium]|nr:S1 RNA-binding domain-containing protein [Anaerolineae bacterium]